MALRDDMDTVPEPQASTPTVPASNVHPSRLERMEDKTGVATALTPPPTPAPVPIKEHIDAEEPASDATPDETEKEDEPKDATPEEEQPLPPVELIGDTGRLFVRNLTYTVDKTELETLFSAFGPVSEIHIPIFRDTKLQKGFAFVEFLMPEHAVQAYSSLDGSIFQGRILEILPGKEKTRKDEEEEDESMGKKSFKSKKEKAQKATAGNEFNWNSLFMNVRFFFLRFVVQNGIYSYNERDRAMQLQTQWPKNSASRNPTF
jgi:multiple RNA-binding domain-containing protein 1